MNNCEDQGAVSLRFDYEEQHYSDSMRDGRLQPHDFPPKMDTIKRKSKNVINPWSSSNPLWNKIFLASCVIGVSIDPLFLYIPIINDDRKCLEMDHNIKNIALVLRSITDFAYLLHLLFRLQSAITMSKHLGLSIFTWNGTRILFKRLPWSYLLIDVLAVLPLPQVVVLVFFSKIAGSKSLTTRKFLNLLLLLQYVPRILRVYLSAKELNFDSMTLRVWVRGAFFFFLYIIFGHVFGALWYFYSIFRETKCWHLACIHSPGCVPSLFDCRDNIPMKNLTYLNENCPVNPTNATVFDFGIFEDAIESRILRRKSDFLIIFTRSFWWGLKNLSSFGSNLDTSSNVEENLFAVLISILGLLLFLYLIGTLQTYMQLATTKSEEARRKMSIKLPQIKSYLSDHPLPEHKKEVITKYITETIKEEKDFNVNHFFSLLKEHADHGHKSKTLADCITKILDVKKNHEMMLWISTKNDIPPDKEEEIMRYVQLTLQEGKDISHLLHILPFSIKKHICLPMLKKVPQFENKVEHVYETICDLLKPMTFSQSSYIIRKEEPLDFMLFITQGVLLTFGSSTSPIERLQEGDYYGKELIDWKLNSKSYSELPISTANLKSHTKVEALVLMAIDLEHAQLSSLFS